MATTIQIKRGLASQWTANAVLAKGEIGFETDTGKFKIGNEAQQTWANLPYYVAVDVSATDVVSATHASGKTTVSLKGGYVRNYSNSTTLDVTNPYPKVTLLSGETGPTGPSVGDIWIKY
jgi:nanoRNase/pAp phosphatase (c-di-AMP/oligoRNAs hydrolase)